MAVTVIFDTVEGAELEVAPGRSRRVVNGAVTGVTLGAGDDPNVPEKVLAALAAAGYPLGGQVAAYPNKIIRGINIRGMTNDGCSFVMALESPFPDGPPTAYTVTDDSALTIRETNLLPGTREPIMCGWVDRGSEPAAAGDVRGHRRARRAPAGAGDQPGPASNPQLPFQQTLAVQRV